MSYKNSILTYSEEELIKLNRAIIFLWAEEELKQNPDSNVSLEQRQKEITVSFIENLSYELNKGL